MPSSNQLSAGLIIELENFLRSSLTYVKDSSLPDINLNGLQFDLNNVRLRLSDRLTITDIIEIVEIDATGNLIKKSSNQITNNIIQKLPFLPNISDLQPLVIIRNNVNNSQAHLYRKKTENNQIILEYLGQKLLPTLLTNQALPTLTNDEQNEEVINNDHDVNIIRTSNPIMTLSFTKNGTCYLFISPNNKARVATDVADSQHFKNFVVNNCPVNGSLNIEVDKNGKIMCAYTIDNATAVKKDIKIDKTLIEKIERVITDASTLQNSIGTSSSKTPPPSIANTQSLPTNNSFSSQAINNATSPIATTTTRSPSSSNQPLTSVAT